MGGDTVRENAAGRWIKKQTDLTEGSPGKSLLVFTLPLILGNLFQQFYNMADSMIVGNFMGESALTAAGTSCVLTNVSIVIAIGGGGGTPMPTSQYLGAKQHGKIKTSVSTSLITFLVVGPVLGNMGFAMNGRILEDLNTPENTMSQAKLYLGIYFLGLPFLFMYNVLTTIFNAVGDSRASSYPFIPSSLLNVVLDIISVTWLGMGVDGAAIVIVMAQGVSALISFAPLLKKLRGCAQGSEDEFHFYDTRMLGSGAKIAVPSILQQSIVSTGMLLMQSVANGFGSAALAGYFASSHAESICVVPMIATGNAVATFTAQNIGAGKLERAKKRYRVSYGTVIDFSVLMAVVVPLTSGPIIASFLGGSMSPDACTVGTGYLSPTAYFLVLIELEACTDGLLRGSESVLVPTIANLVNLTIYVFDTFHFAPIWGIAAVWYATPMGWMANYVISLTRYLIGKWEDKRVI